MPRKILVLVVDDFPDGRELVAEYLTFKRFAVLTASTATDAIEIARRVKPQIVLMDLSMPGVDGWDATRILKADPETRDIPVIALTARTLTHETERAFQAGCDGLVAKPFDLETLADALLRILRRDGTDIPGIVLNPTRSQRNRRRSPESL
jgi:two-component system cell cycle response regulator DivK